MTFKTVDVVDTDMLVSSEEELDKKFSPEVTWKVDTSEEIERKDELEELEKLAEDVYIKIQTEKPSDGYMGTAIPFLIYLKAEEIKPILKHESLERAVYFFRKFSNRDGVKSFYNCNECGGYVEGQVASKDYDEIKNMAGTSGTRYLCNRCGTELSDHVIGHG